MILSIPLGILAGSVQNKVIDRIVTIIDQIVMSVPPFFVGILSCFLFGITLRLFTPGNFVSYTESWGKCIGYLIFPALSIALPRIAMTVKMLRGAILNELDQDYVRTSRSRGMARRKVLSGHVLRNALIPTITFLAVSMAEIMTGTIIIEQVFTIPGIGRLLLASINNRDFPVVQAIVVILAAWIVIVNFVADLLYQLVDPRIRLEIRGSLTMKKRGRLSLYRRRHYRRHGGASFLWAFLDAIQHHGNERRPQNFRLRRSSICWARTTLAATSSAVCWREPAPRSDRHLRGGHRLFLPVF